MRPHVTNWDSVAATLIQRVHAEAVGRVIDDDTRAMLDELRAYPGAEASMASATASEATSNLPVVPIGFRHDGKILNYFSMITTVGAPRSIAAQELRIESMFPADPETEDRHIALLGA
jgi:hypothetical protein